MRMSESAKAALCFVSVVVGACVLIVFSISCTINLIDAQVCAEFGKLSGFETRYIWHDTCYVNSPNGWMDKWNFLIRWR